MIEPLARYPAPRTQETPLRHGDHPIRAIAIDIDGTLTDMQRRLDWDGVLALRAAEQAGIPVILATGNVIPATKTIQHCIGTTGPIVCENGGTVYWELPGAPGEATATYREILQTRDQPDTVVQELIRRGHTPRYISSDPWRESEAALELGSIDEDTVRGAVVDMGLDDLYVVATGFACHILHKHVDKRVGIERALQWLNEHDTRFRGNGAHPPTPITLDQVIAIGDSMNDKEMIQGCGVGAALIHAPKALRDVADIVSTKNHGAGVREVLEGLGLDTGRVV